MSGTKGMHGVTARCAHPVVVHDIESNTYKCVPCGKPVKPRATSSTYAHGPLGAALRNPTTPDLPTTERQS